MVENTGKDWRLDTLELKYNAYGDDKGKYTAKLSFSNGVQDSFKFQQTEGMADRFLDLVREEIIKSANELGQNLAKNLSKEEEE